VENQDKEMILNDLILTLTHLETWDSNKIMWRLQNFHQIYNFLKMMKNKEFIETTFTTAEGISIKYFIVCRKYNIIFSRQEKDKAMESATIPVFALREKY